MNVRNSGRTTRMMVEAVRKAGEGRAVYLCFTTKTECRRWEEWRRDNAPWSTMIQFDTPSFLDIDWETMTLRGAHDNCVLFVDHFVIQKKFQIMLDMLHAYDPPGAL